MLCFAALTVRFRCSQGGNNQLWLKSFSFPAPLLFLVHFQFSKEVAWILHLETLCCVCGYFFSTQCEFLTPCQRNWWTALAKKKHYTRLCDKYGSVSVWCESPCRDWAWSWAIWVFSWVNKQHGQRQQQTKERIKMSHLAQLRFQGIYVPWIFQWICNQINPTANIVFSMNNARQHSLTYLTSWNWMSQTRACNAEICILSLILDLDNCIKYNCFLSNLVPYCIHSSI